jgi:hypothetical protein
LTHEEIVFFLGPVTPVNALGLAEVGYFLNPLDEMAVVDHRG